jgi:general secretion pathway protein K
MLSARTQRGVALIAVLWVVAFLATIASTVAHQSRSSLQMTKNRIETLKLKQAAESVLLLSIANKINSPEHQDIISIDNNLDSLFDGVSVQHSISDESGKIDLNTAPLPILQSLMKEIGMDEDSAVAIASAILDWRDEDSLVRVNGAEDNDYLSSGYSYGSKDADFERVEELQLVRGVTKSLFDALAPYITVHTYDYGVNTSVASNIVKLAINNASALSSGEVDLEGEGFESLDEFISQTEGYIYTFKASVKNRSGVSQEMSAIIRIDRGNTYEPFTVLNWN